MGDRAILDNLPPQLREKGLFCCRGLKYSPDGEISGPEGDSKGAKIPYDPSRHPGHLRPPGIL